VDYSRLGEALIHLDHRHNDGTWGSLERRQEHHDPSAHDPEAGWGDGDLYVCTSCDEQVRVRYPAGGGAHPEAG
jgi:hypothetical protein